MRMRSFVTALIVLMTVWFMFLIQFNQEIIKVHLTPSKYFEVTTSFFFLLSATVGVVAVVLFYAVRDFKLYLGERTGQRDNKQQSKVQDLYAKGVNSLVAKRTSDATTYFQKVLDVDGNHVDTLIKLGLAQLRQKNYKEAIRLHQKALSLDSENQEVKFALAADYEEAKQFDDSIKLYQEILEKDASNLTAVIKVRDLYLVLQRWEELYQTQGKLQINSLSPDEQEAEQRRQVGFTYEYGRSLLEGGELEQAKKILRGVIKLNKDFIPAYLALGEVFLEEEKSKEAVDFWEKAYKQTSSVLLLHRLEDFYLAQGEPGKAIEVYTQAVNAKPDDSALKFFLGKVYYRVEMIDEAFDVLSSVDWGDQELPDVHKLLGNIYLRKGSLGLAASEFKKALGFRKQLVIPYVCSSCGDKTTDWSGRCQNCGRWNTYGVNLEVSC